MDKKDDFKKFIQQNSEVHLEAPKDEWRQINEKLQAQPKKSPFQFKFLHAIAASVIVFGVWGLYTQQQAEIERDNHLAEFLMNSDDYFDSNGASYADNYLALLE